MTERSRIIAKFAAELAKSKFSKRDPHAHKKLIFENFRKLGGVYVKFLQMLAVSTDFLDGWAGPREMEVFDDVEIEPIDVVATLQREIPTRLSQIIAVDKTPFATGSFAQVYHARLANNRHVIVKILRPSVSENLQSDLKNIGRIVKIVNAVSRTGAFDVKATYRELVRITHAETDYRRECANAKWFADYFRGNPNIVIPETFAKLSTDKILVQEFIDGMTLADAMRAQQSGADIEQFVFAKTGSDVWEQISNLEYEFTKSAFKADYVIGDPHPGNILLMTNNRVGLIDFGIAADAPLNRNTFLAFIREYKKFYNDEFSLGSFAMSALAFYDDRLSQILNIAGTAIIGQEFRIIMENAASSVFAMHENEDRVQGFLQRRQMTQLFDKVINAGNRFNIRIDPENLALLRGMLTLMATVGTIADAAETTKHFELHRRNFTRVVDEVDQTGLAKSHATKSLTRDQATQLFSDWLSSVADRDPFLYQTLTGKM